MKYKISGHITIVSVKDYHKTNVPEEFDNGYYILSNHELDKDFLINDAIAYFIGKFSTPKKKSDVLKEIEAEIKSEVSSLWDSGTVFFKHLKENRILVSEKKAEKRMAVESLFKAGDFIDDFTVLEVLSNKKVTEIYLVQGGKANKKFILKLVNRNKANNVKGYCKELADLARVYAILHKRKKVKSISRVYGFNDKNKHYAYIVEEFICGKSLSNYLNEGALVSKEDCFSLIENIIHAFSLLHKSKLIHGDIHSSNILVSDDRSIKIIDLGMSKNLKNVREQVIKFGGVNHYMPPERINILSSDKYSIEPDLYSDVYQIGLLIYLVLYKTLPFSGFIWEELAKDIKEKTATFNANTFQHYTIPSGLINIIKKCLNKNPVKRYSKAEQILKDYKKQLKK